MLVKSGPGLKTNSPELGLPDRHAQHVGREHVGRELDALEAGADGARERGGERGLAHARHVLDQQVAAGDETHHRQPNGRALADEGPADVFLEPADEIDG